MLIKQIMDRDAASCYKAMAQDRQLASLEDKIYAMMSKLSEADRFVMEQDVNQYMSRVSRITYLQGIRDFAELFIVLKEDTPAILQKYIDEENTYTSKDI